MTQHLKLKEDSLFIIGIFSRMPHGSRRHTILKKITQTYFIMMKLKLFFTTCLAGAAMSVMAQTHAEGVEYYQADQFNNAKELLLRNMDKPGTDKSISDYFLGLISLHENNPSAAAEYFNKGAQLNDAYPYNFVGLGAIELKNGNVKVAEQLFKDAEKKGKKDAALQIAIARAYYLVDPVAYAKQIQKYIDKARKTELENPEIYIFEGDQLADNKDWGGAAAKYEMAANYDSNATAAYAKYANLFTQVNPDYAITMLARLLELNPESALGQREIANAYYNKQDYKNAVDYYGKYVNNPNHFKQDENRYAFLLFYSQDFQKGYDYATMLLQSDPNNFTAQRYQFMNAAQLPAMKDQLLPLAEALYAAHKANPENKFAAIDYTLIASELQTAKRFDEAAKVLEEAIADMPDNANFNKQLAMLYVDMDGTPGPDGNPLKTFAKSAEAYKGYVEKLEDPGYNDFIQQATFCYYAGVENKENPAVADAMFNDCETFITKAAEAYPGYYKPNKMRGDIAMQRATNDEGVKTAAQPFYEKAVVELASNDLNNTAKNDAKAMYNYLGNYYLDHKDVAKAKEFFNKYLELDPDNADYRKFVESLN